jgi:hypothetical protein
VLRIRDILGKYVCQALGVSLSAASSFGRDPPPPPPFAGACLVHENHSPARAAGILIRFKLLEFEANRAPQGSKSTRVSSNTVKASTNHLPGSKSTRVTSFPREEPG